MYCENNLYTYFGIIDLHHIRYIMRILYLNIFKKKKKPID